MIESPVEASLAFPIAYDTFGERERRAVSECMDAREYTMWRRVREFEEKFANYLGVAEAVMVNSGSSADLIIMLAAKELGILKAGETIAMPAVTWPTQFWAAIQAGFKVKLMEVDPETLNVAEFESVSNIFSTHLMGNPSTMGAYSNVQFEDCCEALGATIAGQKVGTFGLASAFSFFHSHHISTMEGGMVATNDPVVADCCRQLRAHGWVRDLRHSESNYEGDPRFCFTSRGFNFRPTELNAAIGLVQLDRLQEFNYWRDVNATKIREGVDPGKMNPFRLIDREHWTARPAWFAMPFVLKEDLPYSRQDVFDYLAERGIQTRPIVGGNLARQPAFSRFRELSDSPLHGADIVHDRGFYIGLPPFECNLDPLIGTLTGMDSYLRCA